MSETLLIVHVPKAAGTTLRVIMERQYPATEIFKISNDIPGDQKRLKAMSPARKSRFRVIFGHMCWGWHECLPRTREHQYLTMLRDPIERVLSCYAYCKLPGHYLREHATKMDLKEFVASGVTRTCDNGMVRQLCGHDQFLREPYSDMKLPFDGIGVAHLQWAKKNLELSIFGLSERFDDSLHLFRRHLGWRIPRYENKNVTTWPRPALSQVDGNTMNKLVHHTRFDKELYDFAASLFERRLVHG